MEYPGAKFTRPWRKLMLIVFLVAFAVLTPTIVLYTTGYRYDWRYGLLRETGNISVDVLPKNATISLDGLVLPDKMPVRLKNITPHTYRLAISAPGYYDWEKEITVHNRETSYVKEISLLKRGRPTFLTKAHVASVFSVDKGRYLMFTDVDKNTTAVRRFNTESAQTETLMVTSVSTTLMCSEWHSWCMVIEKPLNARTQVLIFNAAATLLKYPIDFIDISEKQRNPIGQAQWDDSSSPVAYYTVGSELYVYPVDRGTTERLPMSSVIDWYAKNGIVYTLSLTPSSSLVSIDRWVGGASMRLALVNQNDIGPMPWQLHNVTENEILVKTEAGMAVITPEHTWTFVANQTIRSRFNNWLLLYNDQEIWGKEIGKEPQLIYRSDETLDDVYPLDEFNTLALVTRDRVTALYHYYLVAEQIIDKKIVASVADLDNHMLYYADKDGLWQLNY